MRSSNNLQSELARISTLLLAPASSPGAYYQVIHDYIRLLSLIYLMEEEDGVNLSTDLILLSGKAISTNTAARCMIDFKRTAHFIRGLYKAIIACQERFPGEKIHILYAGTGPYATLALPMTTLFPPGSIEFTFLEIFPKSFDILQSTISAFKIEPFIRDCQFVDATTYIPPKGTTVHILLTETMQLALRNEPQVAITHHLAPFLHPNGILVPERITVTAALINTAQLGNHTRTDGGSFTDGILKIEELISVDRYISDQFPLLRVSVNAEQLKHFPTLYYLTEIIIFDTEQLTFNESQLTLPFRIRHEPLEGDTTFEFQYETGERPGFKHFIRTFMNKNSKIY